MTTIVGIATPPGRSAIGVIRLSGPASLPIARVLIGEDQFNPQPAQAVLKSIKDSASKLIVDWTILTFFGRPHSFTGEDVVEISCHGSPVVLRKIVDLILALNARAADPGEFTLRALRNGKMDLSQAEAIRDLIDAQTGAAARQAVRQLNGELSLRLEPLKEKLLDLIVLLESALEFVEDDLPEFRTVEVNSTLTEIIGEVRDLAGTFSAGSLLRQGLRVVIIGRPNVGKSSVFNRLLESDRAIVTEIAGTTRDSLTEGISLGGIPILLTDTAGVRDSWDPIEKMGVERTKRAIADADLLLVILDGSTDLVAEDLEVLSLAGPARHLLVVNKNDISPGSKATADYLSNKEGVVAVSALTGQGIDEFRAAILKPFGSFDDENIGLVITESRHYDLLKRVERELTSSLELLEKSASEEIILVGLHNGLRLLGEITGETTSDDILNKIFSSFCIGK